MKPSFPELAAEGGGSAPALGMIECAGIADGFAAADRIVKAAPVKLLLCRPTSPGKHLTLFCGDVAPVTSALRAGVEGLATPPLDTLLLPNADPDVLLALVTPRRNGAIDAAGIVECTTVATLLVAADLAVKTADVVLLTLRAAAGLGGKSFFVCAGEVSQVTAAIHAAAGFARAREKLAGSVVLAQPHRDLEAWLQ